MRAVILCSDDELHLQELDIPLKAAKEVSATSPEAGESEETQQNAPKNLPSSPALRRLCSCATG